MSKTILTRVKSAKVPFELDYALQPITTNIVNEVPAVKVGVTYGILFEILKKRVFLIYLKGNSILGVSKSMAVLSDQERLFLPESLMRHFTHKDEVTATVTVLKGFKYHSKLE